MSFIQQLLHAAQGDFACRSRGRPEGVVAVRDHSTPEPQGL
jgi:hypothetical protein